MENEKTRLKGPLFFEQNRVRRVYLGGALFADFFGDDSTDCLRPEEWVASSVEARNAAAFPDVIPHEGVSVVRGTDLLFSDLIKKYPQELLGGREDVGILVKMLDSAIRLPVQAHPDPAFSEKYLHSHYGKTESWVILACRKDAAIYYGFNHRMTKDELRAAVAASVTDKEAMARNLNRIPVKPGDVFLITAKTVHAIGAGCLLLETQEPTDFTIQPEAWCGDVRLTPGTMYLGLDEEIALDCFDFSSYGDEVVRRGRQTPKTLSKGNGVLEEELISYDATPCFSVRRVTLKEGVFDRLPGASVCVVTEGAGTVKAENGEFPVKRGDYFFIPFAAKDTISLSGTLEAILCLPPHGAT